MRDIMGNAYPGGKWMHQADGVYTVKTGYCYLKGSAPRIKWDSWVWNTYNIPKHSFICWLIRSDKNRTRDKLGKMGVVTEVQCQYVERPEKQTSTCSSNVNSAGDVYRFGVKECS